MEYIKPHPLLNPREPMGRARGGWDATAAAADQWERGDLVEVDGGMVQKCTVTTTAADVGRLAFASAPYDNEPLDATRYGYYTDRGVPLDTLRSGHIVVFTFQHDAADAADHEFTGANLNSVRDQEFRELAYNTAQEVLTIRDGSTTPHVAMKYVFAGEVGDNNVQVACEILHDFRYEV